MTSIDLKNDVCFVTGIYWDLYNTKFGGRHGRYHHYVSSLRSISKINSNIFVYCNPEQLNTLQQEINKRNFSTINFIGYNLENFKYHQQINKFLNGKNDRWKDRCYEIMHGKIFWIKNLLETTNFKYFYWIDAGLSHCGLFPQKFSGELYDGLAQYYEYTLFNPNIFSKLLLLQNNQKGFFIGGEKDKGIIDQSPALKLLHYPVNDLFNKLHFIGGLFGGDREFINDFYSKYDELLNVYLNNTDIVSEETAISQIVSNYNPELYKLEVFDNWHHEDSGEVFQSGVKESKAPFYSIFSKYN